MTALLREYVRRLVESRRPFRWRRINGVAFDVGEHSEKRLAGGYASIYKPVEVQDSSAPRPKFAATVQINTGDPSLDVKELLDSGKIHDEIAKDMRWRPTTARRAPASMESVDWGHPIGVPAQSFAFLGTTAPTFWAFNRENVGYEMTLIWV